MNVHVPFEPNVTREQKIVEHTLAYALWSGPWDRAEQLNDVAWMERLKLVADAMEEYRERDGISFDEIFAHYIAESERWFGALEKRSSPQRRKKPLREPKGNHSPFNF